MDPLTHAASGAIAMLALPARPQSWWALPLAALACASPDLDLLFIHSPSEFLLLHRGISHSFAAMPFFGLLLALCCYPLWRKKTTDRWPFWYVWLFCCGMILLHIWLDIFTTYGTMVFLPFSHYRLRLDSLYIIDPFLTVPLLLGLLLWRARPKTIALILLWCFIYPLGNYGLNLLHTAQNKTRLAASDSGVSELRLLPDAFAPFFWRLLYADQEPTGHFIYEQSIDGLGRPRTTAEPHPAAPQQLARRLKSISKDADIYFDFAVLPIMTNLPERFWPEQRKPHAELRLFYDLRFGSGLEIVRRLLALRPNADMPFLLMAEILPPEDFGVIWATDYQNAAIHKIRLRFSDSGKDSDWHEPIPPAKPDFLQWIVGLQ